MTNLSSPSKGVLLATVALCGLTGGGAAYELSGFLSHGGPVSVPFLVFGGSFLLSSALVFMTARSKKSCGEVSEIVRLSETVEKIAAGDFDARIIPAPENPELKRLALALNRVTDVTDAFLREGVASMEAMNKGQYYRKIIERGLPGSYRHAATSINASMTQSEEQYIALRKHAREFGQHMKDIAANITSAVTSVGSVSAAAEQLSASITEIDKQVERSVEITSIAAQQSEETNALVGDLSKATEMIGSVVQLIQAIAGKTNLLSLNATIEAARAGEAGKGFAVVASEVKSLANQTAEATSEIIKQVEYIRNVSTNATGAVRNIGAVVQDINLATNTIASAVEQQRIATVDIARNIQLAAHGGNDSLHGSVKGLRGQADILVSEVDRFLDQL